MRHRMESTTFGFPLTLFWPRARRTSRHAGWAPTRCKEKKVTAWNVAFSHGTESKTLCHEYRPLKTAGWKKHAHGRSIGNAGGRISRSGNGERCVRITAPMARRGSIFHTITRGREHTAGAKTASAASATGTR